MLSVIDDASTPRGTSNSNVGGGPPMVSTCGVAFFLLWLCDGDGEWDGAFFLLWLCDGGGVPDALWDREAVMVLDSDGASDSDDDGDAPNDGDDDGDDGRVPDALDDSEEVALIERVCDVVALEVVDCVSEVLDDPLVV